MWKRFTDNFVNNSKACDLYTIKHPICVSDCDNHTSANSEITPTTNYFNDMLNVSCYQGYQLADQSNSYSARCNASGAWTHQEDCLRMFGTLCFI